MFGKYITKTLKTSLVFVILFSMFYGMSSADSWIDIGTGPIGGGDGAPTITSVDPASGYNNSTTAVVITGTNLSDVSSLDIGGVPVSSFNIDSATQITAVIQAGLTPAAYHITATNPSGTSDQTAADVFTVLDPSSQVPTVTNVNPNSGVNNVATTVVVTGTNFTGASSVKLGTTTLTYTVNSATQITATVPAGLTAATYHITVTNTYGTSATSAASQFTVTNGGGDIIIDNYEENGKTDPRGQMDGYFSSGAVAGEATIGDPANSTTTIYEGLKSMQLTYPGATAGQWGGYWGGYLSTPAVDAIDISTANMLVYYVKGDGTGNTARLSVTEYKDGTNDEAYRALDSYKLNNSASFKEIKVPYTRIWRDEYSGAVKDDNVFSNKVKSYTFVYEGANANAVSSNIDLLKAVNWTGPIIDLLGPSHGPVGTTVTVIGRNFGATKGTSTITLNGLVAATTSWSATKIVMTVPAGATSGPVEVTVGGAVSNGVPFTVTTAPTPGPMITALTPNVGLAGTTVVITGTNFLADPGAANRSTASYHVTFGLNRITTANVTAWSDTSITVIVPTIANGVYPVQVRANDRESNFVDFTVGIPTNVPPAAPTNLKGVADSTSQITWAWSDNSNNETGFQLFDTAASLKGVTAANTGSTKEAGLSPNTPYTRYAVAYNAHGTSDRSNTETRYTLANPPVNLKQAGSTSSTISFTWNPGAGGSSKYSIYRADTVNVKGTIDPSSIKWIKLADSPVERKYTDSGLKPNTSYIYGVSAYNGDGIETNVMGIDNMTSMSTLSDTVPPTITNVTFNDKSILPRDVIRKVPTLKATILDDVAIDTATILVDMGALYSTSSTPAAAYDAATGAMTLALTSALTEGPLTVTITAKDTSGNTATYTIAVKVPSDDVYIEGDLFNYPNPFNPLGEVTKFGFSLSQDASVNLYLFDTSGRIVLNRAHAGTTGYNEIEWNGTNDYGEVSGNGVYLARLVYGSKLLGKCKVWVVKR